MVKAAFMVMVFCLNCFFQIKRLQAFFKLMAAVLILSMVYLESYLQAILIFS